MSKRKRSRRFFDLDLDEENFLFGRQPIEGGSGYSISVTYDEGGKPVVRVETYGDVDVRQLRRDVEQRYPGARIEGLEKQQLIRIVDEGEKEKEEKEKKKKTELKEKREKKGSPLIREV